MTAVSDAWDCSICFSSFALVRSLAAHLQECHDDWLFYRLPPPGLVGSWGRHDDV